MRLTTKQKADAALAVPCPVHDVPAGEPCTSPRGALAGSCMDRRRTVLTRSGDLRPEEEAAL
jgi:hypothetical protein